MRFRRLFAFLPVLVALLLSVTSVWAQTIAQGPIAAGTKFAWDAPSNVTTVQQALTFEPRLYLDNLPATALTQVTCAIANSVITCQSPTTASNRDAINQVGLHNLQLALFRTDVGEGEKSSPFRLPTPAGAPTALRLLP